MIDEKKLIESIEKEFEGVCVYDVSPSQAIADFVDIVDRQPKVGEWIPCEVVDHPEHCRDCEVTRKDTVGYVRDIAFYTDKWRRLENEMPIDVIAWKEPSAPYNEDMRGGKNE